MLGDLQTNEKKPRETILRAEFSNAIRFINKDLSKENRLKFLSYDLQKHSRKYDGFLLITQIILNFQSFEWLLTWIDLNCFYQSNKCLANSRQSWSLCIKFNWHLLLSSDTKAWGIVEFILHWVSSNQNTMCLIWFFCHSSWLLVSTLNDDLIFHLSSTFIFYSKWLFLPNCFKLNQK